MNYEQKILEEFYNSKGLLISKPSSVYHYTPANTLKSIIENNSLWISDRKYMNDMLDAMYIENIFLKKLPEKIKKTNLVLPLSPQYVFSTSKADDSFFHYNCYGNYCIEFDTDQLIIFIEKCIGNFGPHEGIAHPFTSAKVIYDEFIIEEICNTISEKYPESLEKDINTPYSDFSDFGKWRIIFLHFLAIIKQKGFLCEDEYRFLIQTNIKKKFRDNKAEIIPYIELKINSEKLPIKSIKIGPYINRIEYYGLKDFLCSNGYGKIDVFLTDLKIKR